MRYCSIKIIILTLFSTIMLTITPILSSEVKLPNLMPVDGIRIEAIALEKFIWDQIKGKEQTVQHRMICENHYDFIEDSYLVFNVLYNYSVPSLFRLNCFSEWSIFKENLIAISDKFEEFIDLISTLNKHDCSVGNDIKKFAKDILEMPNLKNMEILVVPYQYFIGGRDIYSFIKNVSSIDILDN